MYVVYSCSTKCGKTSSMLEFRTCFACHTYKANQPTHLACETTLDFSRRYSERWAPTMCPSRVKCSSRYFPKREELSLITVRALPKDSIRGFTCMCKCGACMGMFTCVVVVGTYTGETSLPLYRLPPSIFLLPPSSLLSPPSSSLPLPPSSSLFLT